MKRKRFKYIAAFSRRKLVVMLVNSKTNIIVRAEIHTSYIYADDITIVWQYLFVGDELVQRALIGWYCGEPNDETTKQYANMPLIGQFID